MGRLFARYLNTKLSEGNQIEDDRIFMIHEVVPVLTFEEERMEAHKKKSG